MKLVFEVLRFLLEREIDYMSTDTSAEVRNMMIAHNLLGRVEYRLADDARKDGTK